MQEQRTSELLYTLLASEETLLSFKHFLWLALMWMLRMLMGTHLHTSVLNMDMPTA